MLVKYLEESTIEDPFFDIKSVNAISFLTTSLSGKDNIPILLPEGGDWITLNQPHFLAYQIRSILGFLIDYRYHGYRENCAVGLLIEILVNHILKSYVVSNPDIEFVYTNVDADDNTDSNTGCDYLLCEWDKHRQCYVPLLGIDVTMRNKERNLEYINPKSPGINRVFGVPVAILYLPQTIHVFDRDMLFWNYTTMIIKNLIAYGLYDYTQPLQFLSRINIEAFISLLREELMTGILDTERVLREQYPSIDLSRLITLVREEL